MPEDFEVHGPHDHAVEHPAAHEEGHGAARIAVMTAVLACFGAISAYQSGADENLALLHKNEAAIQKTEAANLWAYYQAKARIWPNFGAALSQEASPQRKRFEADAARYREEEPIRKRAEALEQEVVKSNAASEAATPASSLGAGHYHHPDLDRACCDHDSHAAEMDATPVDGCRRDRCRTDRAGALRCVSGPTSGRLWATKSRTRALPLNVQEAAPSSRTTIQFAKSTLLHRPDRPTCSPQPVPSLLADRLDASVKPDRGARYSRTHAKNDRFQSLFAWCNRHRFLCVSHRSRFCTRIFIIEF